MRMVTTTAWRCLTRRDPWVNMLRNTAATFAGAVGGADVVISRAFDERLGPSDALGRRVARNTPLILATVADDVECAKALLESGASPTAANRSGQSPLSICKVRGAMSRCRALLQLQ